MSGLINLSGNDVRYQRGLLQSLAVWMLFLVASPPGLGCAEIKLEEKWVATVVSIQGLVQVRRKEMHQWQAVRLADRFLAGDVIKVGTDSRAAFVLKNESTLRVDQQSTLVFTEAEPKQPFLIELLNGAVHFFSRIHRSLRLVTPFVNGAVEGTEFVARVDDRQTTITLLEGRLNVFNSHGSIRLGKDQSVTATADQPPVPEAVLHPRDAVNWTLYYPAIIDFKPEDFGCGDDWCPAARQSVAAWRKGDLREAFKAVSTVPATIDDPRLKLYRAALKLSVGQVNASVIELEQAQSSDAQRSDALALLAVTELVQNRKAEARRLIDHAMAQPSAGSGFHMANSYVQQAAFNLDGALASVEAATQVAPDNALAWARLSELYLSKGDRTRALSAARCAATIQPELAHTLSVSGFASLAKIKIDDAKKAFRKAIEMDSAAPMPRLGLGLAKIRSGRLAEGRGDIEIAASLDPGNALIRSYLGKAYYEEKRDDPASVQLSAAKALDSADPTPWFYDAIRKQSINRPVEALSDLQTSIELNDNRAIYRSRLMLDEDLAVRSAGIGQIYRDLGFQQLALVQGWKSVNTDPTNYSAHRFLADNYSVLPRHEIARVSELLQSQLFQPLNITPVQPSLAEANTFILAGTEPSAPSFNDFGPLFLRNRLALRASGVVGSHDTRGDELVQSGVWNQFSYSIGQFYYATDGFRENNDHTSNLYNAFAQVSLTPDASLLAEFRYSDEKKGDLPLRFNPDDFYKNYRQEIDRQSLRIGGRYSPNRNNHILGTVVFSQLDGNDRNRFPASGFSYSLEEEQKGYMAEIQHLYRSRAFHMISGIGHFHSESDHIDTIGSSPPETYDSWMDHTNPYLYTQIHLPDEVTWTIGAGMDFYDSSFADEEQFNPKMGVTWSPAKGTTLRAAAFRTFKRNLIANQTVEPTQVAGFNQFYDDGNRTEAWHYGAAVDQAFGRQFFGGLEFAERDLLVSFRKSQNVNQINQVGWEEKTGRGYLFWTPHDWISASFEYGYALFERDPVFVGPDSFTTLKTHKIPIGVKFFHPDGVSLHLKTSYVHQSGSFDYPGGGATVEDSDQFWVVDTSICYRLPNRLGILSLEVKNLFDKGFRFQDTDPSNPEIIPERSLLAKLMLAF